MGEKNPINLDNYNSQEIQELRKIMICIRKITVVEETERSKENYNSKHQARDQ